MARYCSQARIGPVRLSQQNRLRETAGGFCRIPLRVMPGKPGLRANPQPLRAGPRAAKP